MPKPSQLTPPNESGEVFKTEFLCNSSMAGSSEGLTPQIHRYARSFQHNLWRASEDMGQVSVACRSYERLS